VTERSRHRDRGHPAGGRQYEATPVRAHGITFHFPLSMSCWSCPQVYPSPRGSRRSLDTAMPSQSTAVCSNRVTVGLPGLLPGIQTSPGGVYELVIESSVHSGQGTGWAGGPGSRRYSRSPRGNKAIECRRRLRGHACVVCHLPFIWRVWRPRIIEWPAGAYRSADERRSPRSPGKRPGAGSAIPLRKPAPYR
jgi:hypothetical protein